MTTNAGGRWLALVILTFTRIGMGFQFQSVGAVGPLLMERLHVHNAELGMLIGLASLPGILLSLPGGVLGTRFGDRRVVVIGLGLMAVGSGVIGCAGTFELAVAGRLVSATGSILVNVLLTKMMADWFVGHEIIWAMAALINAWPVGIGLALFVLPTVAVRHGVATSFFVAAGVAVLGLAAITTLYRSPTTGGPAARPPGLLALSRREVAAVALAAPPWMLYNAGYAMMLGFVPTFLVGAGFTVAEAGFLLGVSTLLVIASVQAGGAAAQWWARTEIIVSVGLLAFGLGLVALPQTPVVPTLILIGALGGLPAGTLVAAPAQVLRAESRGPGTGLFYTIYYVGMSVLPPLAGRLQDVTGRRTTALYVAGALFLMALPCRRAFRELADRTHRATS